jgi:uncharacterized membrane protein YqjE
MKQLSFFAFGLFSILIIAVTLVKNSNQVTPTKIAAVTLFVIALTAFSFAFYHAIKSIIDGHNIREQIKTASE